MNASLSSSNKQGFCRQQVAFTSIAITLNFQPFSSDGEISYYLAVGDRNGKVALATVSV